MGVRKRNLGGSMGYRCGKVMERRNMLEAKGLESGPWTVAWIWVRLDMQPSSSFVTNGKCYSWWWVFGEER